MNTLVIIVAFLAIAIYPYWQSRLNIAMNITNLGHLALQQLGKPDILIEEHEVHLIQKMRNDFVALTTLLKSTETIGKHEQYEIPSSKYDYSIPITVYTPVGIDNSKPANAIIYYPGGGFVVGSPLTHEGVLTKLTKRTNSIVFAVDYHKAPEYKFPHGIHDCIDATSYVISNAANFNINPMNIVVMGDSAGGHITAIISVQPQFTNVIKGSVMIYPVIVFGIHTLSKVTHAYAPLLTSAKMDWYSRMYFEHYDNYTHTLACATCTIYAHRANHEIDPDIHHHIPNVHIITAEVDPLHSEGESYYQLLTNHARNLNIKQITYKEYSNTIHGFFGIDILTHGEEALNDVCDVVKSFHLR